MSIIKITLCSCGGQPEIKAVGDNKQYFACVCSNCSKTPLHIDEAQMTKTGAIKLWNRRSDND